MVAWGTEQASGFGDTVTSTGTMLLARWGGSNPEIPCRETILLKILALREERNGVVSGGECGGQQKVSSQMGSVGS